MNTLKFSSMLKNSSIQTQLLNACRISPVNLWMTQVQSKNLFCSKEKFEDIEYKYTTKLQFKSHEAKNAIPCYRILDKRGKMIDNIEQNELDDETVVKMYKLMIQQNELDDILNDIQRQGRISFYMQCKGEEAALLGTAAGLSPKDVVFAQYREPLVLAWRGYTIKQFMGQCFSNADDSGKGRQMPVHYGSKELNFQQISSPLATQIPQATGAAYAQKLLGKTDEMTVVYFGEGAASEGDFHAALNFAVTLKTPTLFICRNNKYAISTPAHEQYGGDAIAGRGVAYGMPTIRVDGNDLFAVYSATKKAREIVTKTPGPVLMELMTYRVGHHSTSDDSTRYREQEEIDEWKSLNSAVSRTRNYLEDRGLWDDEKEANWKESVREIVLEEMNNAESQLKPSLDELFTDVYEKPTPILEEQKKELEKHLALYPDEYPIDQYMKN